MVDKQGKNVCKINQFNYRILNMIKAKIQWEEPEKNVTLDDALNWLLHKIDLPPSIEEELKSHSKTTDSKES